MKFEEMNPAPPVTRTRSLLGTGGSLVGAAARRRAHVGLRAYGLAA
jgi:hypothetical protein